MYLSKKEEKINVEEKDKKKRNRLSNEATIFLQRYFELTPRPTTSEKKEISKKLCMDFRSVQVWFQNRRAKHKKDMQDPSSNLTQQVFQTSMAGNNSLFVRKDAMERRPFYESYPIHCKNDIRYDMYSNDQYFTYGNTSTFSNDGNMATKDFFDTCHIRPRKWFKFHDYSEDKAFNKENNKIGWNNNFINIKRMDDECEEEMNMHGE